MKQNQAGRFFGQLFIGTLLEREKSFALFCETGVDQTFDQDVAHPTDSEAFVIFPYWPIFGCLFNFNFLYRPYLPAGSVFSIINSIFELPKMYKGSPPR